MIPYLITRKRSSYTKEAQEEVTGKILEIHFPNHFGSRALLVTTQDGNRHAITTTTHGITSTSTFIRFAPTKEETDDDGW